MIFYITIPITIYIISIFLIRKMIISKWKTRLTTLDIIFTLVPIVNTIIIIGRVGMCIFLFGKKMIKKFIKWYINEG